MAFIKVRKKLIVITIYFKFRDTKQIKKHKINILSISSEDVNPINFKTFGEFTTSLEIFLKLKLCYFCFLLILIIFFVYFNIKLNYFIFVLNISVFCKILFVYLEVLLLCLLVALCQYLQYIFCNVLLKGFCPLIIINK